MAHAPLYYATYRGPDTVGFAGEGAERRGYPLGQTVEIAKPDADAIRKLMRRKGNTHEWDLEAVPAFLIGTAEENQPTHPGAVHERNEALVAFHEDS